MYSKYVKRIVDLFISIIALPLFGLLFLVFAPLIKFEDGGTVFFRAKRRGLNGRVFEMYKFRSMKMNAPDIRNKDNSTFNAPNDPRLTKIGKFLRETSIDETAQVLNILKGDMSVIGPRPVTTDKPIEQYDQKRLTRLKVRPGLTGYVQAYYRQDIGQEEKLALEAEYAEHVTLWGDIKIFFKTIETVFRKKNIYIKNENIINNERGIKK